MQTIHAIEMIFTSSFGFAVLFIFLQCLLTNKTIFDVFKSESYRLVSNGREYKIQQRVFAVFWVDFYGYAIKKDDGCLDITVMSEEAGKEILESLKLQASENKRKNKWTTIAE